MAEVIETTGTDVEAYEPESNDAAIELLGAARAFLAQAANVEAVSNIRDQAEAIRMWSARRDDAQDSELAAADIVRRAERRIAELVNEMKIAGLVRKPGRPKKSGTASDDSDEEFGPVAAVSPKSLFANDREQKAAAIFATIDEDTFNEVLEEAKAEGDLSRNAILRRLSTRGDTRARANDGLAPIARVVPRMIRALSAVAETLAHYDAAEIDDPDRKNWAALIREHVTAIEQWRKRIK